MSLYNSLNSLELTILIYKWDICLANPLFRVRRIKFNRIYESLKVIYDHGNIILTQIRYHNPIP